MSGRAILLRLSLNLFLFMSILFSSWWVVIALMILLLIFYEAFEVLLWGIFFDMLYSIAVPFYFDVPILFTLFSIFLFIGMNFSKRYLIFYT